MALAFLLATVPALRPLARPTASRESLSPALHRRELLVAAAGAGLSLGLPKAAFAASKSNLKKRQPLQPELVFILRVQESTGQEAGLVSSGKLKDLARLNIKRSVGMILDNSDLQGRFVAATAYADPNKVSEATAYGSQAVEALVQILEYFPDKLAVNDLTSTQKNFILSALKAVGTSIDNFLTLMPPETVALARAQIAEENALNLAEFPKDMELLNGVGILPPKPKEPPPPEPAPPPTEPASAAVAEPVAAGV